MGLISLAVLPTYVGLNRGACSLGKMGSQRITHGRGFESEGLSNVAEIVTGITHGRGFELVWWSGTSRLLEDEE